ncbi:MAG: HEAT repeat domain-containing protein [Candidatus Omnitrophota bacterium]|nr:MAG: HEAT repeat domain-containing protein [Candidatus Omnitrophota bacterium]
MKDARFNSWIAKRPYKGIIVFITIWSFLFNTVGPDILLEKAWAAGTPLEPARVGSDRAGGPGPFKELNVNTFTLPQYLGHIKDMHKADSGKVIVHIQDAHCNYAAQHKIADIIEYLHKRYGIKVVNLEGGKGEYDLSVFTRIQDKDIRKKVVDYFVKEGLVNGAEYFAINNPDKAHLWGVENTELYLRNFNVYKDSLKHKGTIEKYLKGLDHIISNLKRHIYSAELLALDRKYTGYKQGKLEFKDYLAYLIRKAGQKAIDIKTLTNIYLLHQSLKQEDDINFKTANMERNRLIDEFEKMLSKNDIEELVQKTVAFKAEQISQKDFYAYLVKKAKSMNLDLSKYSELKKYIVYISMYDAIDKFEVMEEMDTLENRIKDSLYKNGTQKELNLLSKNLALTRNIFNVSLTSDDYAYYKKNKKTFDAQNYVAFIDKQAPLHKITAKLDDNIDEINDYRENLAEFYEYSLKRDSVFLRNTRYSIPVRQARQPQITILVAGGFHTENLCELFKRNNISYISIMPNFKNGTAYKSPYFELLGAKPNSMIAKLQKALHSSLAIATFLSDPALCTGMHGEEQALVCRLLAEWRRQVEEGKIADPATELDIAALARSAGITLPTRPAYTQFKTSLPVPGEAKGLSGTKAKINTKIFASALSFLLLITRLRTAIRRVGFKIAKYLGMKKLTNFFAQQIHMINASGSERIITYFSALIRKHKPGGIRIAYYPGIGFDAKVAIESTDAETIVGVDPQDGPTRYLQDHYVTEILACKGASDVDTEVYTIQNDATKEQFEKLVFTYNYNGGKRQIILYRTDARNYFPNELKNGYDLYIEKGIPKDLSSAWIDRAIVYLNEYGLLMLNMSNQRDVAGLYKLESIQERGLGLTGIWAKRPPASGPALSKSYATATLFHTEPPIILPKSFKPRRGLKGKILAKLKSSMKISLILGLMPFLAYCGGTSPAPVPFEEVAIAGSTIVPADFAPYLLAYLEYAHDVTMEGITRSIEISNSDEYQELVLRAYDELNDADIGSGTTYPVLFLEGLDKDNYAQAFTDLGIIVVGLDASQRWEGDERIAWLAYKIAHERLHIENPDMILLEGEALTYEITWRTVCHFEGEDSPKAQAQKMISDAFAIIVDEKDRISEIFDGLDFRNIYYNDIRLVDEDGLMDGFVDIELYNRLEGLSSSRWIRVDIENNEIITLQYIPPPSFAHAEGMPLENPQSISKNGVRDIGRIKESVKRGSSRVSIDDTTVFIDNDLTKQHKAFGFKDKNSFLAFLNDFFANEILARPIKQKELVVSVLDTAGYLFEDHLANGFIGIHRSLFEKLGSAPQTAQKLLKIGLKHELSHETGLTGKKVEKELLEKDIKNAIDEELDIQEVITSGLLSKDTPFIAGILEKEKMLLGLISGDSVEHLDEAKRYYADRKSITLDDGKILKVEAKDLLFMTKLNFDVYDLYWACEYPYFLIPLRGYSKQMEAMGEFIKDYLFILNKTLDLETGMPSDQFYVLIDEKFLDLASDIARLYGGKRGKRKEANLILFKLFGIAVEDKTWGVLSDPQGIKFMIENADKILNLGSPHAVKLYIDYASIYHSKQNKEYLHDENYRNPFFTANVLEETLAYKGDDKKATESMINYFRLTGLGKDVPELLKKEGLLDNFRKLSPENRAGFAGYIYGNSNYFMDKMTPDILKKLLSEPIIYLYNSYGPLLNPLLKIIAYFPQEFERYIKDEIFIKKLAQISGLGVGEEYADAFIGLGQHSIGLTTDKALKIIIDMAGKDVDTARDFLKLANAAKRYAQKEKDTLNFVPTGETFIYAIMEPVFISDFVKILPEVRKKYVDDARIINNPVRDILYSVPVAEILAVARDVKIFELLQQKLAEEKFKELLLNNDTRKKLISLLSDASADQNALLTHVSVEFLNTGKDFNIIDKINARIRDNELKEDLIEAVSKYIEFGSYLSIEDNFEFVVSLAARSKNLAQAYIVRFASNEKSILSKFKEQYEKFLLEEPEGFAIEIMTMISGKPALLKEKIDITKCRTLYAESPYMGQLYILAARYNPELLSSDEIYNKIIQLIREDKRSGVKLPPKIFPHNFSRRIRDLPVGATHATNRLPYGYQLAEFLIKISESRSFNFKAFIDNIELFRKIHPESLKILAYPHLSESVLWDETAAIRKSLLDVLGRISSVELNNFLIHAFHGYIEKRDQKSVKALIDMLSNETEVARLNSLSEEIVKKIIGWERCYPEDEKRIEGHPISDFIDGESLRAFLVLEEENIDSTLGIISKKPLQGGFYVVQITDEELKLINKLFNKTFFENLKNLRSMFGEKVIKVILSMIKAAPRAIDTYLQNNYTGILSEKVNAIFGENKRFEFAENVSQNLIKLVNEESDKLRVYMPIFREILGHEALDEFLSQGNYQVFVKWVKFFDVVGIDSKIFAIFKSQMKGWSFEEKTGYLGILSNFSSSKILPEVLAMDSKCIRGWVSSLSAFSLVFSLFGKMNVYGIREKTAREFCLGILKTGIRDLIYDLNTFTNILVSSEHIIEVAPLQKMLKIESGAIGAKQGKRSLKAKIKTLKHIGNIAAKNADSRLAAEIKDILKSRISEINSILRKGFDEKQTPGEMAAIENRFMAQLFGQITGIGAIDEAMLSDEGITSKLLTICNLYFNLSRHSGGSYADRERMRGKIRKLLTKYQKSKGDKNAVQKILLAEKENKGQISKLKKAGYSESLWKEGVKVETEILPLSEAMQLEQIRENIAQISHEIIEIAEQLKYQPEGISAQELSQMKFFTYNDAKEFTEQMKKDLSGRPLAQEQLSRIGQILANIKKAEDSKDKVKATAPTKVRIVIKKDFVEEANAGVGVPGCFSPNGLHREMPIVHALEANSFFALVYDESGTMFANAVLALTDKGVVVFGAYNTRTDLDLEKAWLKAWMALSRVTPAVILPKLPESDRIGGRKFAERYNIGATRSITVTKEAIFFGPLYYDFGKCSGNGDWSFTNQGAIVLKKQMFPEMQEDSTKETKKKEVNQESKAEAMLWNLEKGERKAITKALFKLNLDIQLQPVLSNMDYIILRATEEEITAIIDGIKSRADPRKGAPEKDKKRLKEALGELRIEFKVKKAFDYVEKEIKRKLAEDDIVNTAVIQDILYVTLTEKMNLNLSKTDGFQSKGTHMPIRAGQLPDTIIRQINAFLDKALLISDRHTQEPPAKKQFENLFGEYLPSFNQVVVRGEMSLSQDGGIKVIFESTNEYLPVYDQDLVPEGKAILQFELYKRQGQYYMEILDIISKTATGGMDLYQVFEGLVQHSANYIHKDILMESETAMFRMRTPWNGKVFAFSPRKRDIAERFGWHHVKKVQSKIKIMWIERIQPILDEQGIVFENMAIRGINQKDFGFYEKAILHVAPQNIDIVDRKPTATDQAEGQEEDVALAAGKYRKSKHDDIHKAIEEGLPDDLKNFRSLPAGAKKQVLERYRDNTGQIAIPIKAFIRKTGLLGHIGLGQYYGEPVIYADSSFTKNALKFVKAHELYEIGKWESFRKKVDFSHQEMRSWIRENSNNEGTGLAQRLAKKWDREAPSIDWIYASLKCRFTIQQGRIERIGAMLVQAAQSEEYKDKFLERYGVDLKEIKEVSFFVYEKLTASPFVAITKDGGLIIGIPQSTAELLNDDEVAYALGHELAHFQEIISNRKDWDGRISKIGKMRYLMPRRFIRALKFVWDILRIICDIFIPNQKLRGEMEKIRERIILSHDAETIPDELGLFLTVKAGFEPAAAKSSMNKMITARNTFKRGIIGRYLFKVASKDIYLSERLRIEQIKKLIESYAIDGIEDIYEEHEEEEDVILAAGNEDAEFERLFAQARETTETLPRALTDAEVTGIILDGELLLEKALKDQNPSVRERAASSIGGMFQHNPEEAEKFLKKVLEDPNPYIQREAASNIAGMFRHNPEEAEKLLKEALKKSDFSYVRKKAAGSIGSMFQHNPKEAEKLLKKALKDRDWYIRSEAASSIADIFQHNPKEAEKLLKKALKKRDWLVRSKAASSIGGMFQHNPKEAEKLLKKALKDQNSSVREGAASSIEGMFQHNPEEAESLLKKVLKDQNPSVREGAASSIGGMFRHNPKEAESLLKKTLKDPDPYVRRGAASSIGGMFRHNPKEAESLLKKTLKDTEPNVRKEAACSIGGIFQHKPKKAKNLLKKALKDPDPYVQIGATSGIGSIFELFSNRADRIISDLIAKHSFLNKENPSIINSLFFASNIRDKELDQQDIERYNQFKDFIKEDILNKEEKEHNIPLAILSYLYPGMPHWDNDILTDRKKLLNTLSCITDLITDDFDSLKDRIMGIKMNDEEILSIFLDLTGIFFKEDIDSLNRLLKKGKIESDLERKKELLVFFINTFGEEKIEKSLYDLILNSFNPGREKDLKRFFRYISLLNAFPEEYMDEYKPEIENNRIQLVRERKTLISILTSKLKALLSLSDEEETLLNSSMENFQEYWQNDKFFERVVVQAAFFTQKGKESLKKLVLGMAKNRDKPSLEDNVHYEKMREKGFSQEFIDKWKEDKSYYIEKPKPEEIEISYQSLLSQIMLHLNMTEDELERLPQEHKEEHLEEAVEALLNIISSLKEGKLPDAHVVNIALAFISSPQGKGIFNKELITDLRNLLPARIDEEELKKASRIRITSDSNIFMRAGLEPHSTCQRATSRTAQNKDGQLINRILHGQFKLAQYLIGNTVIARTHLETTTEDGKPVLLVEEIYQHIFIPYDRNQFEREILKYASSIGIKTIHWSQAPQKIQYEQRPNPPPVSIEEALYRDTRIFNYATDIEPPMGGGMDPITLTKYAQRSDTTPAQLVEYLKQTGLFYQADIIKEALKSNPEKLAEFERLFAQAERSRVDRDFASIDVAELEYGEGEEIDEKRLLDGYRGQFQNQDVHVRGIALDRRVCRNYINSLRTRTKSGKKAIAPVHKVYVPVSVPDIHECAARNKAVLCKNTRLRPEVLSIIRNGAQEGLFELVELRTYRDYRNAEDDLGIKPNYLFSSLGSAGYIALFVSEWIGPNLIQLFQKTSEGDSRRIAVGANLGRILGALHNAGLVAGDSHLKQFVIDETTNDVYRIDTANITSTHLETPDVREKVLEHELLTIIYQGIGVDKTVYRAYIGNYNAERGRDASTDPDATYDGKFENILESRQAQTIEAFNSINRKADTVKAVVGVPKEMNQTQIQQALRVINRGLARSGFGDIRDTHQVITFEIDVANPEQTRKNYEQAMDNAHKQLPENGRIVLFAPQIDIGPQLAKQAQDQYKEKGYITVIPDAYTDSHPEQNEYPDIEVRVALARHVAFYYNGNDQKSAIESINKLLQQVSENAVISTLEQLLDILNPLKIRPIVFENIAKWQKYRKAIATSL